MFADHLEIDANAADLSVRRPHDPLLQIGLDLKAGHVDRRQGDQVLAVGRLGRDR